MSKNTNNNQTVDEKKGKRTGLTILGYVLVIVALLIVHSVSEFPSAALENLTIIKQTLCLRNRISYG